MKRPSLDVGCGSEGRFIDACDLADGSCEPLVQTFDVTNPIEMRANATTALGALGFNAPSLLGVGATAPYFHDGSARTLGDVFARHVLGTGTIADAFDAGELTALEAFVRSIDAQTPTFASDADAFLP